MLVLKQLLGPLSGLISLWALRVLALAALITVLAALLFFFARPARAQAHSGPPVHVPTAEDCLSQAARARGLDPALVHAVAQAESNLQPRAINRSNVERTGTVDIGLMQINSAWLPTLARHGISAPHLLDPCVSAQVGAWLLADALARHGNTWDAVGAYNAACTSLKGEACTRARQRYAWRVFRRMPRVAPHGPSAPGKPAPAMRSGLFALTALAEDNRHSVPTASSIEPTLGNAQRQGDPR